MPGLVRYLVEVASEGRAVERAVAAALPSGTTLEGAGGHTLAHRDDLPFPMTESPELSTRFRRCPLPEERDHAASSASSLAHAEDPRADGRDDVQRLEVGGIIEVAPRHSAVTEDELREEGHEEPGEDERRREKTERSE